MMDELLADCVEKGYRRIGLVMTYNEGGIGHKLFTSSFLYYQSKIPDALRIPILPKPMITAQNAAEWFRNYRPDVIISAGAILPLFAEAGVRIPQDVAFASIDVSEPPCDAAGADHRYNLVGQETLKLVLGQLNLNLTGTPEDPKIVLVDSHRREGYTLPPKKGVETRLQVPVTKKTEHKPPTFRGFID